MHPILFKIGNFNFYTHGFLAVIGIVIASYILNFLAYKKGLDRSSLYDNLILAILFGIIGAKLAYIVLYREQFSSIWQMFAFWNGGLVSYGGFILGGVAFLVLLKKQKQSIPAWFDLLATAFPIGLFFGRIGNIYAGDISGIPSRSLLAVGGRLSAPAFEAVLLIAISILLFIQSRKSKKDGLIFLLFLITYSGGRFIIDFLRADPAVLLGISLGQFFSLAVFLFSSIYCFQLLRKRRKPHVA